MTTTAKKLGRRVNRSRGANWTPHAGKKAGAIVNVAHTRVRPVAKPRADRDEYLTPADTALAACARLSLSLSTPTRIIEPSAGTGIFVAAAKRVWPEAAVHAIDIHEPHRAACLSVGADAAIVGDWMKQDVSKWNPDLVIGNPPFALAEEHIRHALAQLREGAYLAFLLPTSFLCSRKRAGGLWSEPKPFGNLRYYCPLAERPSFTGDGKTDMTEYAVYVWQKGFDSWPQTMPHIWRADAGRILGEDVAEGFLAAMEVRR